MKLTEVKIILEEIEDKCSVNLLTINGMKAWPLIRSIIWSEFTKSQVDEKSVVGRGFSVGQKIVYLVDKFGVINLLTKLNPTKVDFDAKVLFVGRAQHRVRIKGIRKSFDRIMDPLVYLTDVETATKSFSLGIPKLRNSFFPTERLRVRRLSLEFRLLGLEESNLLKCLSQLNALTDNLLSAIDLGVREFSKSYMLGCDLLSKAPNSKHVFISVWYSIDALGIIAAAHQRKMQVIDIQHGGEMHGMYAGWRCVPENGYELLPDVFWCWGKESLNRIERGMKPSLAHRCIVGGYPWHEFRAFQQSQVINDFQLTTTKSSSTKVILFSLQPLSFDVQQRVPEFILNFLKLDNPKISFNFRRHPNDPDDKKELMQLVKTTYKTRFEISNSSADLIEAIRQADFHISAFSSVAFECLAFGVPTLLYGEQSKVLYDNEISEGVFSWTAGREQDILRFLRGDFDSKFLYENYISTPLELVRNELLRLVVSTEMGIN